MPEQRKVRIAIIGGGPKAVAICAKASILNRARFGGVAPVNVHVSVFEPNEIGAHWKGRSAGYTDGEQRLCTLIERDLGFPYASGLLGRIEALALPHMSSQDVAQAQLSIDGQRPPVDISTAPRIGSLLDIEMQALFSWPAFLTNQGKYREWIDSGRKPPTHAQFAEYLHWSLTQTDASMIKARVTSLRVDSGKWSVHARLRNGRTKTSGPFDGVVATGPGPMTSRLNKPVSNPRIFDGVDFWKRLKGVKGFLDKEGASVAILGGGGTGAAVLAWLARSGYCDTQITLITNQATIYTRTDNWFESRLFSDSSLWDNLSKKSREAFFDRVNRGVVWNSIVADLEKLNGLQVLDGRAASVKSLKGELQISVADAVNTQLVRATIAVDATGFDAWYFGAMLPNDFAVPATPKLQRSWKDAMTEFLDWQGGRWPFPPLHAPMLAEKWGPGLGSLMSLGVMSDRVLGRYLT